MDVSLLLRQRLNELGLDQRRSGFSRPSHRVLQLTIAGCGRGLFLSPDAPTFTRRSPLLGPSKRRTLQTRGRQRELKKRVAEMPVPVFKEGRQVILGMCEPYRTEEVQRVFDNEPFGELLPRKYCEGITRKRGPRVISDNGPQFIAKGFKEFMRVSGMPHVRTSPYYPHWNGKIEHWHKSLKGECIRPGTPLSLEDARRLVEGYVGHDNDVRLNRAIGYITPKDRKLEEARKRRQIRRQQAA